MRRTDTHWLHRILVPIVLFALYRYGALYFITPESVGITLLLYMLK